MKGEFAWMAAVFLAVNSVLIAVVAFVCFVVAVIGGAPAHEFCAFLALSWAGILAAEQAVQSAAKTGKER